MTRDFIPVRNPYDATLVAEVARAGKAELERAIRAAETASEVIAGLPTYEKFRMLSGISLKITENRAQLARVLSLESAKPWRYALGEIDRAAQTFLIAAEEAKRLPREYIDLDWTPAGAGKEGLVRWFPVGLVGGISPFNFPMNLAVHKIAPAIAAGCPIILKPSSSTPLSTLELARIIDKSGLPKGTVSILPMDRETGNQLVTDERIKLLSFTGSPEVGWKMKSMAGKKKVVLELGGNAGVIITPTADIDQAARKCTQGGFFYSGQVCIHTQRVLVHRSLFRPFAERMVSLIQALKYGDPLDSDTDVSVMIDEENAIRVEQWVNEAVQEGAEVLYGGKRNGVWYPPTLISGTQPQMKVCALEVFGPVVTLDPYDDFEEAVSRINSGRFGLQAGVFTDSIHEMNRAFAGLRVGGVIVNDVPTFRVDHMPYGGVKDSGLGREGVLYAIRDMMEARILVRNK